MTNQPDNNSKKNQARDKHGKSETNINKIEESIHNTCECCLVYPQQESGQK